MALTTVKLTAGVTGTLGVANGGTGLTSGTTDQLLKFTGTTTLASSAISTGKVLQVTGNTSNTKYNISSTSQVETITHSITPSATSSKVLVYFAVGACEASNTSNLGEYYLIRDISGGASTDLLTGGHNSTLAVLDGNSRTRHGATAMYLDSPNTTSAIEYKVNIAVDNATMNLRWNRMDVDQGGTMFMILQEVAG